MATKVVMAQLSPTMEEGKLVEWRVAEGDDVSQGDVVAEIETDKANMEVEAMGSGVLRKILVQPGQTVPVGELIGIIAPPDEDIEALIGGAGNGAAPPAEESTDGDSTDGDSTARGSAAGDSADLEAGGGPPDEADAAEAAADDGAPEAADDERQPATGPTESTSQEPPGGDAPAGGRVKASPVARRIAQEKGLDLSGIAGTGPGGRIVKADVEAALAADESTAVTVPGAARPAGEAGALTPPSLEDRTEEASQMRKAIARRLSQSIGPVPHFFLTTEIDMAAALDARAVLNERGEGDKVSVNDLLLKVAAEALKRHPAINASWEGDAIRYHGSIDLGIAVALDGGLITPVLRGAGSKGLRQISREARELIQRARDRKLGPEEYQGATFSISNLGMFEIDQFTAIINPPEAAILAVGRTQEKPVVVDGELSIGKRMRVTMSCDHRVIDGATGAAFLGTFKAMLENPLEMLA